jgi:hypothetical protein
MNLKLLALVILILANAEGKINKDAVIAAAKVLSKVIKELVEFGVDNIQNIQQIADHAVEKAGNNGFANDGEKAKLIADLNDGIVTLRKRLNAMKNNRGVGAASTRTKLTAAIRAAESAIKALQN